MRKLLLLCMALTLGMTVPVAAQLFLPPLDTLAIRKDMVFSDTKSILTSSFASMNDSNKRAQKMYGRWENHWRSRLYLGAPTESKMFTSYNDVMVDIFIPSNPWEDPDVYDPYQTLYTGPSVQKRCIASYPAQWQPLDPYYPNQGYQKYAIKKVPSRGTL